MNKKNLLLEISLILFVITAKFLFFNYLSSVFLYSILIIYFFLKYKNIIYSPFTYLIPGSFYLLPGLFLVENNSSSKDFVLLFMIGISFFSIIYEFYRNPRIDLNNLKNSNYNKILNIYLFSFLAIISTDIISNFYPASLSVKAILMIINMFSFPSIYGALLSIAKRSIFRAFSLSLIYLGYLLIKSLYLSGDPSRIYAYYYAILLLFIFTVNLKDKKLILPIKQLRRISSFIVNSLTIIISLFLTTLTFLISGGDLLIVNNAVLIIEKIGGDFQPLMFLHNGLLIFLPSWILPYSKPSAYNPSAWILENILNIDPSSYPYGVGSTMVGSGYIYGGLLGVIFIFSLIAYSLTFLERNIDSYFFLGFYGYIVSKIPEGIFKMSEESIIPNIILFFIIFPLFRNFIKNYLYKRI